MNVGMHSRTTLLLQLLWVLVPRKYQTNPKPGGHTLVSKKPTIAWWHSVKSFSLHTLVALCPPSSSDIKTSSSNLETCAKLLNNKNGMNYARKSPPIPSYTGPFLKRLYHLNPFRSLPFLTPKTPFPPHLFNLSIILQLTLHHLSLLDHPLLNQMSSLMIFSLPLSNIRDPSSTHRLPFMISSISSQSPLNVHLWVLIWSTLSFCIMEAMS